MSDQLDMLNFSLGEYKQLAKESLGQVAAAKVVERIWQQDHTVWRPDPEEISNRLGWLTLPGRMQEATSELEQFADSVYEAGLRQVILLGMGGSSLAPEVFRQIFGVAGGRLDLRVLDSTDPEAIENLRRSLKLEQTLFVVATKSGTTVETLSFFKYFHNQIAQVLGDDVAGDHFVAITDPGTNLVDLAEKYHFRRTFINDPNLGGRYSALSYFGLVPAALVGVELDELLARALSVATSSQASVTEQANPAVQLGTAIAELAGVGRDKLTFVLSDEVARFGDWVEQLIAESTGKQGKGILPVVGVSVGKPADYRADRVFIHLRLLGDDSDDEGLAALNQAGHPLITINLRDKYDIGGQIFLWELATAVAGERMDINPFDQPNVESAKKRAKQMVQAYEEQGALPDEDPIWQDGQISAYWGSPETGVGPEVESLEGAVRALLAKGHPGSYMSLHAYLTPSDETTRQLSRIQQLLRNRTRRAVTVGYGPRFLHSTGQLHKGDGGHGLFLQLTKSPGVEISIPESAGEADSSLNFGVLIQAQARGDRQALAEAGRSVLRLDLGQDQALGLAALIAAIGGD